MPPTQSDEGIRLATRLRVEHPEIGVVVLSQYAEPGYVLALLDSGSDGRAYLLKERVHDRAQLVGAIEAVAAVEKHINAIFLKLNLSDAQDAGEVSPRVKAALLFLAEPQGSAHPLAK